MIFNKMIPELSVFNIEETVEFYKGIGFAVEYERLENKFVFMSFQESQFMFEEIHCDGWNTGELDYPLGQGINFSIEVEDVESLYEKLRKQNIEFYKDIRTTTYQVNGGDIIQREFLLQDPNGYLLRFTD